MSNDLIMQDPYANTIRAATAIVDPAAGFRIPTQISPAGLCDTWIIIHRDGNGASTLAHFLACLMDSSAFIIEVGTPTSRALNFLPEQWHLHLPASNADALAEAIDRRMDKPSSPSIIECGRTLYKEGIEAALNIAAEPFCGRVVLCFLASEHDANLKVPNFALMQGVKDVLVFAEATGRPAPQQHAISIPRLPPELAKQIYSNGLSIADALDASLNVFSRQMFFLKSTKFAEQVVRSVQA